MLNNVNKDFTLASHVLYCVLVLVKTDWNNRFNSIIDQWLVLISRAVLMLKSILRIYLKYLLSWKSSKVFPSISYLCSIPHIWTFSQQSSKYVTLGYKAQCVLRNKLK